MLNPLFTKKIQRVESRKISKIYQGCFREQDSVVRIAVNIPTASTQEARPVQLEQNFSLQIDNNSVIWVTAPQQDAFTFFIPSF